jgi:hypothetical protein
MGKRSLIAICLLMLTVPCQFVLGQKSLEEIPEPQRIALHKLKTNKLQYDFISETLFGEDIQKDIRGNYADYFGRDFRQYYKRGDFNRDRKPDFAMILMDNSEPESTDASGEITEHGFVVVIFNGYGKDEYRSAHTEKIRAPKECLIHVAPKIQAYISASGKLTPTVQISCLLEGGI